MKKILTLVIQLFFLNICFAQPGIDDIVIQIDNDIRINAISGSGSPLWNSFKSNINFIFDEIDVIKRNNVTSTWDPSRYVPFSHCACGEKYVTLSASNFTEVKFSPYITVIEDYSSNNDLTEEQQKEQAKIILEKIMEWLAARNISITNVKNIDILYTTTSGGAKPMVAYGFEITYKICVPCPN
jgi:hypothetical protein